MGRGRFAVLTLCATVALSDGSDNCFVMMDNPLAVPPFSEEAVGKMRQYFMENLNVHGKGACTASPGAVPALSGTPGGYNFDWVRDCSLSVVALIRILDSEVGWVGEESVVTEAKVVEVLTAYMSWVETVQGGPGTAAHGEPKWEIAAGKPFGGNWCRPQTDGPGLRARALMTWAARSREDVKARVWKLVKFDLDWLAQGKHVDMESCDLWEESRDRDLLWNHMMMRAALNMGGHFAESMGDSDRAESYRSSAKTYLGDVMSKHTMDTPSGKIFVECPVGVANSDCHQRGKDVNGATILALIHSGWMEFQGPDDARTPAAIGVARTVKAMNEGFCKDYDVNRQDSQKKIPGILYGRYMNDAYGGGNPWVLITAALASLMFQAAQVVANGVVVDPAALDVWKQALDHPSFKGTAIEFIAAGDAILVRLGKHLRPEDDFHLYEQIDKKSGKQWNAKDLTWSYAELLSALQERSQAIDTVYTMVQHSDPKPQVGYASYSDVSHSPWYALPSRKLTA